MNIPLVDLKAQYAGIKGEIDEAIASVIADTAFVGGPYVAKFEEQFASFIGAPHCVGVGNGTDALAIALQGLGIGPGDEVIVPAMTFIATSEAVTLAGGKVVFADVDPVTRCLDPEQVRRALSPRTKAVIGVHLYGHPADMPALKRVTQENGLLLIEDAAQAHGAFIEGRKVGTWGDAACFSFYPGKNLGAYGDGGAILTGDAGRADKMRMLANHGRKKKYGHVFEGCNSRLDGMQAAILSAKLAHLADWTKQRRRLAARYSELLAGSSLSLPQDHEGHVYHLYVVTTPQREELLEHLKQNGVGAGIHYPDALPRLKAYERLGHGPGAFPVAEGLAANALSLPLWPEMSPEQQDYVVAQIHAFWGTK
ncbi:MAG: DegT/DnrJ/EryC1/StrS family aminotransferase [Proteobacteria bacterium]|nr:DegT/DnrJ/EryC1/StrS family aminotransferase [Pseudomonadota bacterium]MBU4384655.1 DegT/DnrJ/EryC1/StrS family aminotransferase [Pseudomonadota bacterium]MCG2766197.1 DegT/DnrJ/EryC1/StrS family aminotransferase [Desulfarculaceae bacterium]